MNDKELRLHALKVCKGVWPPPGRYTFAVGLNMVRTCTVKARGYEEAYSRAVQAEDRKAEWAGREAPVAWTLTLLKMELTGLPKATP